MNLSPLQKLEDIIKKSSYYGKDGYNPSALLINDKKDDTRFSASIKLTEVVDDLDRNKIINIDDVDEKFKPISQIDPAEKIYIDLIDLIYKLIYYKKN